MRFSVIRACVYSRISSHLPPALGVPQTPSRLPRTPVLGTRVSTAMFSRKKWPSFGKQTTTPRTPGSSEAIVRILLDTGEGKESQREDPHGRSPASHVPALATRAVDVPLARPHLTAGGAVNSMPLVLTDLLTEEGVVGRSYASATPVSPWHPWRA